MEIHAFGGRRKPQKTADSRRKPKILNLIFAEKRRKPQIGVRHLRSVTSSSALLTPPITKHSFLARVRFVTIGPIVFTYICPIAQDICYTGLSGGNCFV